MKKIYYRKESTPNDFINFFHGTIRSSFLCFLCRKVGVYKSMPATFLELLDIKYNTIYGGVQFCDESCLNIWILQATSSGNQLEIKEYSEHLAIEQQIKDEYDKSFQ